MTRGLPNNASALCQGQDFVTFSSPRGGPTPRCGAKDGAGWLQAGPWPRFSEALKCSPRGHVSSQQFVCSEGNTGGLFWMRPSQTHPRQSRTHFHLHFSIFFGGRMLRRSQAALGMSLLWNASLRNLGDPKHGEHCRNSDNSKDAMSLFPLSRQQRASNTESQNR